MCGPHRQHGRGRDSAALAEAEVVGRPVGEGLHPHGGERLVHAGLELGTTNPEVGRAEGDVVVHGRHEQLVIGVLEDDPDTLADLAQVRLRDRQPRHPHLARPTAEDAVEVKDERRLACAVRPEERDALALVDREVDAEQRAVAIGVGEGDAADLEAPACSRPPPTRSWR